MFALFPWRFCPLEIGKLFRKSSPIVFTNHRASIPDKLIMSGKKRFRAKNMTKEKWD
jgi:hypothetical protein